MTKSIAAFQDEFGRITSWPSDRRREHQLAVLDHLARLFEGGVRYPRAEVTRTLQEHTTLPDPDMLLQELLDGGYLSASPDGETIWHSNGR
ncbi:DUF2087 domain-containing protein [Deinococcus sonorensis]|uniref:DUF2087 domain-containing protein n=2 Tax=Deinococcus sonorensis TaxID=309891 RepID=A0AAU7UC91_9DEIO